MLSLSLITAAPILVAIIGDKLLGKINYYILRACIDSFTHGAIGLFSWIIVLTKVHSRTYIISPTFETVLCGIIALAIDIDHFWTAKSLKLRDALQLGEKRAPLHSTLLLLITAIPLLIVGKVIRKDLIYRFGVLMLVAVGSHHIRDGVRRGLWFPPFGSTSPLPYSIYIASIGLVPHISSLLLPFKLLKYSPIDIV